MKKWLFIAPILALIIGVIYLANYDVKSAEIAPTQATEQLNADTIFKLVNEERVKAGVAPLVRDSRLDASALEKAVDMDKSNYFDHVNPKTGVRGYTLIPNGICITKGENISDGIYSDNGNYNKNVVRSWMESTLHREAILDSKNTLTGVAVSNTKVVQHFCVAK